MTDNSFSLPVADLHCDLLSYLVHFPTADLNTLEDIGASLPHLKAGNVKIQVLAMFSLSQPGSVDFVRRQAQKFVELSQSKDFTAIHSVALARNAATAGTVGIIPAIENASGLCETDEPISMAFQRMEEIIDTTGRILYLGLTHHTENRFGGGNFSDNIGIKPDGEALLEYLHGRQICIDLAHTSDALAYDILDVITKKSLDIPVIASHSNFRPVCDHVRNLPDELTKEIIDRKGLIGINFLRAYVDEENPRKLFDHILYGKSISYAGRAALAFGADFFSIRDFPDSTRYPLFFPEHENASKYPEVLKELTEHFHEEELAKRLAWDNVIDFLARIWK